MNKNFKDLTTEDLNDILIHAVEIQSYDVMNLILKSDNLKNTPNIHKIISPKNPLLIALRKNDIKAMIILIEENVGNKFIRSYETMTQCLHYATENKFWDMCMFLMDIHPELNAIIPYKTCLSNGNQEEALKFYDRIKDKGEALMCACYHGSEFFFNKATEEKNIEFNYDLTFAYIIKTENNKLMEVFLEKYSDNINWLKSNYFVEKIIETKNLKNMKFILEHSKIKDSFDIDSYAQYFNRLMIQKDSQESQDMLDYLVFDYVLKFKGLSNYGKGLNDNDLNLMENKFHKRDLYLKIQEKFKEKNIKIKKQKI